jgi:uncharacterized protein (TIGR02118 family)
MIKVIALLKRKPGMTLEEFSTYYFNIHAPLAMSLIPSHVDSQLLRYVQNHAVQPKEGRSGAPYDCVVEMGFVDIEAVHAWRDWYESTEGEVLREDEEQFMDRSARIIILTEERSIRGLRPTSSIERKHLR